MVKQSSEEKKSDVKAGEAKKPEGEKR